MRKWNRFGKRIVTYTAAAALAVSAVFGAGGFVSEAKSYIQYHNIIVRDAAAGEIIGGVDAGQEVTVLGSSTGSDGKTWSQVRYVLDGVTHEGWVRSDLITEDASKVEGGLPQQEPSEEGAETRPENAPVKNENSSDKEDGASEKENSEEQTKDPASEKETQQESAGEISGDGYLADGEDSFLVRGISMTLSDDFADQDIPDGFEKASITYNGKSVQALKAENGNLFLVYLTHGEDGAFYVLDTERNCVFSMIQLTAGDTSVVLTLPPLEEKIASGYKKTLFAVNDADGITAYTYAQDPAAFNKNVSAGDYYFVYGMDQAGVSGWFLYDAGMETFVRSTSDLSVDVNAASEHTQKETQTLDSLGRMILVGILFVFVILLIAVTALGIRCRRMRSRLPEEDGEDEDLYEEEPRMTFAERRRERRSYRHFMEDEKDGDEAFSEESEEDSGSGGEEVFVLDSQEEENEYLDEEEGQEPEDWEALIRQIEAEREFGSHHTSEDEKNVPSEKKPLKDDFDDDLEFLDL